jgi:hypothetical protein
MPNILDRYFEEASRRIPKQPTLSDKDIPCPEYPEHDGFDPAEITGDNDELIPVEDRWTFETLTRRLAERDIPFPISEDERGLLDGDMYPLDPTSENGASSILNMA